MGPVCVRVFVCVRVCARTIISENNNKCQIWLYSILNGLHVKYILILTQKISFQLRLH